MVFVVLSHFCAHLLGMGEKNSPRSSKAFTHKTPNSLEVRFLGAGNLCIFESLGLLFLFSVKQAQFRNMDQVRCLSLMYVHVMKPKVNANTAEFCSYGTSCLKTSWQILAHPSTDFILAFMLQGSVSFVSARCSNSCYQCSY